MAASALNRRLRLRLRAELQTSHAELFTRRLRRDDAARRFVRNYARYRDPQCVTHYRCSKKFTFQRFAAPHWKRYKSMSAIVATNPAFIVTSTPGPIEPRR